MKKSVSSFSPETWTVGQASHHVHQENVGAAIVNDVSAKENDGAAENVHRAVATDGGLVNDVAARETYDGRLQILSVAEIFP